MHPRCIESGCQSVEPGLELIIGHVSYVFSEESIHLDLEYVQRLFGSVLLLF